MSGGRMRVALGVALIVALVAAGVAVVERDRRSSLEARLARLEEQRRVDEERRAPARTPEATDDDGGETQEEGGGAEGLVSRLLESFLGPGSGVFSTSALEQCVSAFEDAGGGSGGLAGLLGGGRGGGGGRGAEQPSDPGEQLRRIAGDLEKLRELRFEEVPDPVFLPPDELSRRVQAEVRDELPPDAAARDVRGLAALGALEPGADLQALTLRALGEQVAGFYEPETGELVVRRADAGAPLDGMARMILAHELDHALTDQVLDLPVDAGRPPAGTEDAALARLALVEGDASLAMQLYTLRHVGLLEQLSGLSGALGAQQQLTALPHHLQRTLSFPYVQGLSFACRLHDDGGWGAVDRAYDEPPTTTAQVLFPERYEDRETAVDPRDPPGPGGGWTSDPPRSFGAAELSWLLEAPGGDTGKALDDPTGRVTGWAGGELHGWTDDDRTAAALVLVERPGAKVPLCTTVAAWYQAAFPGGRPATAEAGEELALDGTRQDAVLRCSGRDVRLGLAPDVATARALTR